MLWRIVHLFVAALAAACLLFQTKAVSFFSLNSTYDVLGFLNGHSFSFRGRCNRLMNRDRSSQYAGLLSATRLKWATSSAGGGSSGADRLTVSLRARRTSLSDQARSAAILLLLTATIKCNSIAWHTRSPNSSQSRSKRGAAVVQPAELRPTIEPAPYLPPSTLSFLFVVAVLNLQ